MSESQTYATPATAASPAPWTRPLTAPDLALFAELLAGLVRSKMPLPEALRLLGKEAESRRLRAALAELEREVSAGATLDEALEKQHARFPDLFRHIVAQGLAANDLHAALLQLVREYRAQSRFRTELWTQLISPLVTALVVGVMVLVLMLWNLPLLLEDLWGMRTSGWDQEWANERLPWPSRVFIAGGRLVRDPLFWTAFAASAGLCVLLARMLWAQRKLRYGFQRLGLMLPVLGPYLRVTLLERFCRLLALLMQQGLTLPAALGLTARAVSFEPLRVAVEDLERHVKAGGALADGLERSRLFPKTLAQYVRGAEVHGDLAGSLRRLADLYAERGLAAGGRLRYLVYFFAQATVGALVLFMVLAYLMPFLGINEALRRK